MLFVPVTEPLPCRGLRERNRVRTVPFMSIRTYSLEEIATILCGTDGPTQQRWVLDHLRGYKSPTFPGFRAQQKWRMTQADIDTAIDLLRPNRDNITLPNVTTLTVRSRRRLAI